MQILITDKGNFLVENEGKYGFFDKSGKFLRLSDKKEWDWSAERMKVSIRDTEPEFDLKAMAEAKPVVVEEVVAQNNSSNKTFTLADLIKPSKSKKVVRAF